MSSSEAVTPEELGSAMRLAPATVAIVTAQHEKDINGLTATSFCSVSMDPPSMLVCVNQDSRTHGLISKSKKFCINLLRDNQSSISNAFASSGTGQEKLEQANTSISQIGGVPCLEHAAANMVCDLVSAHDYGTHTIFVGDVLSVSVSDDAEPLLYGNQSYGVFSKV